MDNGALTQQVSEELTRLITLYCTLRDRWTNTRHQESLAYKALSDLKAMQTDISYYDGRTDFFASIEEATNQAVVYNASRKETLEETMQSIVMMYDVILHGLGVDLSTNEFWSLEFDEMLEQTVGDDWLTIQLGDK